MSYDARMSEGKKLRAAGQPADAVRSFSDAAAAAAPGSADYALARYFVGLCCQDLMKDAEAVAPLEDATRIYGALPGQDQGAALIGAALGLSLMRELRWKDAARVMEESGRRLPDTPQNAGSRAAGLHNLAIVYTRSGDPVRGLEAARRAIAIREKTDGPDHPLTVETRLIEAHALVDAGEGDAAAPLIRRAALRVLQAAGEAHPFFADALLVEARRLARIGDGGAAEACARRALHILEAARTPAAAVEQRKRDAAALGALWRTGAKARDAGDVALWRVSIRHTLRRYQAATLDFAGSGDRPLEWYLFVPAAWMPAQALYAARVVMADISRALNAREPADANFLDATAATASRPAERELSDTKFADLFRARVWEPSIAYSLVLGDRSLPIPPPELARALAARGVSDAALAPLGADAAALSAARSDPQAALRSALGFAS